MAARISAAGNDEGPQHFGRHPELQQEAPMQDDDDVIRFACPACAKVLRARYQISGKQIRCPHCGQLLVVPDAPARHEDRPHQGSSESIPLAPLDDEVRPEHDYAPMPKERYPLADWDDDEQLSDDREPRRRRRGRRSRNRNSGSVTAPAICLLVTGCLGILFNLFQALVAIINPRLLQQNNAFGQNTPPALSIAFGLLFAVVSIVVVAGAIAMLTRKLYGLGMTGSILAILNIGNCCCLLGLPFGIWSLVVLARPEVRELFEDSAPSNRDYRDEFDDDDE
jgi:hypothetical protein